MLRSSRLLSPEEPTSINPALKQYAFCRQSSVYLLCGCFLNIYSKITCQFFFFFF